MMIHKRHVNLLGVICCLLLGCSGSSLDSDTDTPTPNVLVNAGVDQSVDELTTVTLNAQATGQGSTLTFSWSASPVIVITHDDASVGMATFVAPATTEAITYNFTVDVVDGEGNRASDQVQYQINPVNVAPVATITASQIEGLAKNQYPAGEIIILDASTSMDPDAPDNTRPIKSYLWQQTAGESVLQNISTQGDSLSFTSPILDVANTITIAVTVTDQEDAQTTESIVLDVQSAAETLPKVEAGVSHEVFTGENIILDGVATTTVAASEPLTSIWLNDSEKDPLIHDLNAVQTYAVAPSVLQAEEVTFTLRVQDTQGNVVEDSLTVNVKPLPIQPLNDTGVVQQATDTQISASHIGDYPGQDGQRGQDVINENGFSEKAGRGTLGFDFTRLDEIGDEVDDPTLPWSCVRDNITGLIWESKTTPVTTGLHSNIHTYSWFQEEDNGGFEGNTNASASCSIDIAVGNCNTSAFLAEVNSQGLCNFNDWRLPTHEELLSLVHLGRTMAPMIDPGYFPNTTQMLPAPTWYWTQDSSADGLSSSGALNAWAIDFSSGNDNFLNKSTAARVRLVRAGR